MKAGAIAKVLLPVVLVAGGGVAFAASSHSSSSSAVRAWVDSPLDGSTIEAGKTTVLLHASADDVDELTLVVDGKAVGSAPTLEPFGNLVKGEVSWAATAGSHELVARATRGSTDTDSHVNEVLVVAKLPAVPALGDSPTGEPPSTTTTAPTSTTTTAPTTTEVTTTTEEPASTTTAPEALPDPPSIVRLSHAPRRGTATTPVTITVEATGPDPASLTITIQARQAGADWADLVTCDTAVDPCKVTPTLGPGTWHYRATVVDAFGQDATGGDTADTAFQVFG